MFTSYQSPFAPIIRPDSLPDDGDIPLPPYTTQWGVRHINEDRNAEIGTIVSIEGHAVRDIDIEDSIHAHHLVVSQSNRHTHTDSHLISITAPVPKYDEYNKDAYALTLPLYIPPVQSDYGIFYPHKQIDKDAKIVYFHMACQIIDDDLVVLVDAITSESHIWRVATSYPVEHMNARKVTLVEYDDSSYFPDKIARVGWIDTSLEPDPRAAFDKMNTDYTTMEQAPAKFYICGVLGHHQAPQFMGIIDIMNALIICDGTSTLVTNSDFYTHRWKQGDLIYTHIYIHADKDVEDENILTTTVVYLPSLEIRPEGWESTIYKGLLGKFSHKLVHPTAVACRIYLTIAP